MTLDQLPQYIEYHTTITNAAGRQQEITAVLNCARLRGYIVHMANKACVTQNGTATALRGAVSVALRGPAR